MRASFAFTLLLVHGALAAQGPPLRVEAGGRTATFESAAIAGTFGYPSAALRALGGRITPFDGGMRAVLFGDTISFWVGSPFFVRRAAVEPLVAPVTGTADGVILPAQFFTDWLPARFRDRVRYVEGALIVSGPVAFEEPAQPAAAAGPRVVIIDPGHGGEDTGKIGPNGLREKDAALQLSRRLATILEDAGYEVHLTRTTDTLIALSDRSMLANRWKAGRPAALFVSIHFNSVASPASRTARGFETFFLSAAQTEDEQRVADLENASVQFEDGPAEPLTDEMVILNAVRNDFYIRASNDLAEAVQRGIATVTTSRDRGVKRAGFRVLVGALMPAVLIEAGFISHAQEAAQIGDPAFQASIAKVVAEAIVEFFDGHQHLWGGG